MTLVGGLVLSGAFNLFLIGFYLIERKDCLEYKEKASYWLTAYNRISSSYMDLAKEKRNQ